MQVAHVRAGLLGGRRGGPCDCACVFDLWAFYTSICARFTALLLYCGGVLGCCSLGVWAAGAVGPLLPLQLRLPAFQGIKSQRGPCLILGTCMRSENQCKLYGWEYSECATAT